MPGNKKVVCLWTVARTLSTAFERAIRTVPNIKCVHEPYGTPAFAGPEATMPDMYQLKPSTMTFEQCAALTDDLEGNEFGFRKDMAYYIYPDKINSITVPDRWRHAFLVRHPARTARSLYTANTKMGNPFYTLDVDYEPLMAVFEYVRDHHHQEETVVVDAEMIQEEPLLTLQTFCKLHGLPYTDTMTEWRAGTNPFKSPFDDSWYTNVVESDGITASKPGPLPSVDDLPDEYRRFVDLNMPYYEALTALRMEFDADLVRLHRSAGAKDESKAQATA